MNSMRKKLDKTYVAWVLFKTGYTKYKLAKTTGITHTAINNYLWGRRSLRWEQIIHIEEKTGCTFADMEHISFSAINPELFEK